jgi:hypothetical protein
MAIVGSAQIVVYANTSSFNSGINNSLGNAKKQFNQFNNWLGGAFSARLAGLIADNSPADLFKGINPAADAAYASVNQLITRSYFLQSALAGIIPVLASFVGGLFALGSQIAATSPALIVLPSIFTALAQGMITAKLAFGGVSKALQGFTQQSTQVSKLPSLVQAVATADDRLKSAIVGTDRAQRSLNAAYRTAAERLQQLGFDSEDAAIGQKRAAIDLEKARETLARVQDLPADSRTRREAELAFKEADLNYRRAVDRNSDLKKEQDRVSKGGTLSAEEQIKQSDEVVDASAAQENAIRDRKRAVDALAIAEKKLKDYQTGKGEGSNAFAGVTKEAKEFAKFLFDLKPKIEELRIAAQKALFPALETAITNLVDKGFPTFKKIIGETATALGEVAISISNVITEGDNLENLRTVASTNNDTIKKLGRSAGNLYDVFITLLAAADPLIRRFTTWVELLTDSWKEAAESAHRTGRLADIFKTAGDIAANLGDIIGNLVGALINMGKAASGPGSGGEMIFDSLERITKKFKDFTGSVEGNTKLQEYFRNVSRDFMKIGGIFAKIIKAILGTGGNESGVAFLDSISIAVDNFIAAFSNISGTGGGIGGFIVSISELVKATAESGGIKAFFEVVNTGLGLLGKILTLPFIKQLLIVGASLHGLRSGIKYLGDTKNILQNYGKGDLAAMGDAIKKAGDNVIKLGGKFKNLGLYAQTAYQKMAYNNTVQTALNKTKDALTKLVLKLKLNIVYSKLAAAATKVWTGIQAAFNAVMAGNPVALTIIAIIALIAIVVIMYKKFDWFRRFVDTIWQGIQVGLHAVYDVVKVIGSAIADFFVGVWGKVLSAWDAVWPALVIAFKIAVGLLMLPFMAFAAYVYLVWKGIKIAFDLVWPVIVSALSFAWENIIKPIFGAMLGIFTSAWEGMKIVFDLVWGAIKLAVELYWNFYIKPIFEGMLAIFTLVWGGIKAQFNLVWDIIKTAISFGWNNVIKPIFDAFGVIFGKVWSGIKTAFSGAWDFITGAVGTAGTVFGKIGTAIKDAFTSAINFIIRAWNKIEFKVPEVKVAGITVVPGFTLGLPNIPELAEGGVINPSPGGTLAKIGEAGKPERVEPLDKDGLSKRDRAIITMLSGQGKGGGITINVETAPGMSEVELASIVSRQLAFQMRKGVL